MAGIGTANPYFSCYKKPRSAMPDVMIDEPDRLTEILLEVA